MDKILEELGRWGCDIDNTLERFVNDKDMYLSCLRMLTEDETFFQLGHALQNNKIEEAFNCAHTLKGVVANMGITPMYELLVKIVEPLRNKDIDVMNYYNQLMLARINLISIIGNNK